MIHYIKRTREVYQKLKGCPAQREVYDALDFHRPPTSNISDTMTLSKLSQLSGTARQRVRIVLDQLVEKGLIQIVLTKKKYVFQCLLLDIREPDVVKLKDTASEPEPQQQYTQEEIAAAAKVIPF